MQLKALFSLLVLIGIGTTGFSQTDKNSIDDKQEESRKKVKVKKSPEDFKDTEVNFLFNYYEQDGDHSPVTGGMGTEELDNIAPSFVVHVPLDSLSALDVNFGVDIYSSASTDNIDYFDMDKSSASSKDARVHFNAAYSHTLAKSGNAYSIMGGASVEYDVTSFHAGGSYTFNSQDNNRSFTIDAVYMNDTWNLIYPTELRTGTEWLKDDVRSTLKFGLSYSQVINKRLQALFSAEVVSQTGLLSTPFHRVFFDDANLGDDMNTLVGLSHVEQLDDSRLKIPLSMRWNYYLSDFVRLKTFYRFYTDTWGITAHTASVELPMMISQSFIVSPFFRYHTQTAADDFYEFGEASASNPPEFYTSDYDLSDLDSYKVGVGIQYSPVMGIGNFKSPFRKGKIAQFKSVGLRAAYYDRSDGLNAWLVSLDFGFTF